MARRFAIWAVAVLGMIVGVSALATPAYADILTPPAGATVALPATVSGTGTAGLEIYIAAIADGLEVAHCSTTVAASGIYSCAIPPVRRTGAFQFVIHQFPVGQSPTPRNTFDQVSVTVVDSLPVTPAGRPTPFFLAGLILVAGGLVLLYRTNRRGRHAA